MCVLNTRAGIAEDIAPRVQGLFVLLLPIHNQQLNMLHPPAYSPLCSATSSIMAAPQNFFLLTPLPGP